MHKAHFHLLIRKCTAWVTPRSRVNGLILRPLIKLARLGSDKKCIHPVLGSNYLPVLYDVISSAFQNTPCVFFSYPCELARHESSTRDECLGFKTSASFSSATESHRSRVASMLLAPPEGNSATFQGKLHSAFRWMRKSSVCARLYFPTLRLTWWPDY